ncbi:MAG: A/G-specific adenine glycosylase [Gammaproteobacteria bacterium]|nr:A/G-specific adenine glycosylase [Gammaproteobacteria bacterium]
MSEINLTKKKKNTVIPYFTQFMQSFPDVTSLAAASEDNVLHHWSGLGYYSRARNLHAAARQVVDQFNGEFPAEVEQLLSLPGIGRSPAGAIAAIAFEQPTAILDGNVKRVLARHFAVDGWPGKSAVAKQLWHHAEQCTPLERNRDYTQAIMDLGATLCTRNKPRCDDCPVNASCVALAEQRIAALPGKKPKKILPQRSAHLLLIENAEGHILLQKNPPSGIWGGLWCLPEASQINPAMQWQAQQTWPTLRHSFSHYHLDITPLHCKLLQFAGTMDCTAQLWYNVNQPANVGLAAPIAKLLQQYAQRKSKALNPLDTV